MPKKRHQPEEIRPFPRTIGMRFAHPTATVTSLARRLIAIHELDQAAPALPQGPCR